MPADHKVSVGWQIVALFVPIANFWAFYRIRKLRKYLLYAYVPSLVLSTALLWYVSDRGLWVGPAPEYEPQVSDENSPLINQVRVWRPVSSAVAASYAVGIGFLALSIYLVVKWSRQHNRSFDSATMTTSGN